MPGNDYPFNTQVLTATISSGQSLSNWLDTQTLEVVGLIYPAAWTSANLYFAGGLIGSGAGSPLLDETLAELNLPVSVNAYVLLLPGRFRGTRFLALRSGPSGAPVSQAADRAFSVVCRQL